MNEAQRLNDQIEKAWLSYLAGHDLAEPEEAMQHVLRAVWPVPCSVKPEYCMHRLYAASSMQRMIKLDRPPKIVVVNGKFRLGENS